MNDTISRKAAIHALTEMYCKSDEDGYVWIIRGDACFRIDALPSAQPERKKGKWKITPVYIKCSECGESFMLIPQNFCPNCGADMRDEEDERPNQ